MSIRLKIIKLKTPVLLSKLHRRLFAISNGLWNDFLTSIIKLLNPKVSLANTEGIFSSESTSVIVANIKRDGYHVCETKLNEDSINRIFDFSKVVPLRYVKENNNSICYSEDKVPYEDCETIQSPRFQFEQEDTFKLKDLRDLIFDKSILNIAQEYLGSRPIFDLSAFWWSKKCNNKKLEDFSAQKYHFDMDRIKFLKFFFYITDVNNNNGPHCFVEGSHKNLLPEFRGRGRFEDEKVRSFYGEEKLKRFTGKKGSILIVDTRGLHKGAPLVEGERLLFQIQFSNSMFGAPYPKIDLSKIADNQIKTEISNNPLIYGPIFN